MEFPKLHLRFAFSTVIAAKLSLCFTSLSELLMLIRYLLGKWKC